MAYGAWIEPRDDGRFDVHFPPEVRNLLRDLAGQLRELLLSDEDDPSTIRLFPPAYVDNAEGDSEYQRLMHDDLLQSRLARSEIMERTADAPDVSEEELTGWLAVLNDLRLVLGTRLDISEDSYEHPMAEDDPSYPAFHLYALLTEMQEEVVQALAS